MMNFLLDVWNGVMGSGLIEPTLWIYFWFVFIFIVMPSITLYVAFKITMWILNGIRDWWHRKV
jgi:hypothetical protein